MTENISRKAGSAMFMKCQSEDKKEEKGQSKVQEFCKNNAQIQQ